MKLLIKGGRLIDPANGIDGAYNVLLENGRVAGIFTAGEIPDAEEVLDAEGMIVAPGFIDLHMHEDHVNEDGTIRQDIFLCMLRMGVTTVIGGNCGDNVYDPAAYLDLVDRDGCAVNVGLLAGHSSARHAAGLHDRYAAADAGQRETIKAWLKHGLDAGCLGISFGVRYVPGCDDAELRAAASAGRGTKKILTAHVRDDADAVFSSIREVVELAKAEHLAVQISHIGSMAGFGQMDRVLADMEAEIAGGLDMGMDCYPYMAFSTELGSTTYDPGWLERYHCGYDALEFSEGPHKGERATEETFLAMRKDYPDTITVCYVMKEDEVTKALRHPRVCPASDGLLNLGQGHPRAAGTFPRFLREFVLSGGMELSEGIRKMTALPASRMGLTSKGHLGIGADADVVIFDAKTIRDRADFAHPVTPPEGIRAVIVGGNVAMADGRECNVHAGKSVRK